MNVTDSSSRISLLIGAGLALIVGILGGAGHIHTVLPAAHLADIHGQVMVLGFLGGAIGLERAVAARVSWGYLSPFFTLLGTILLIVEASRYFPNLSFAPTAISSFFSAQVLLAFLYIYFWSRRRGDLAILIQGLGAVSAGLGVLAFGFLQATQLNQTDIAETGIGAPCWPLLLGFPLLTIIGERIELGRVGLAGDAANRSEQVLVGLSCAYLLAATVTAVGATIGVPLLGAILIGITAVAIRSDIARRTVRAKGLVRFSASAILLGYFWLLVAGLIWLLAPMGDQGAWGEAALHAITLGFTMSMIFAHAPIIIPAVIGRSLPYRPVLWVPLVTLHLGLIVRFGLGSARSWEFAWRWGGALNIAAILVFMASVLVLVLRKDSSGK